MKNILKFAAALAVMVTVSCNKEMNPSEGVSPEGNTVKVTMNATAGDPMSKMLLNGTQFEWEEGDEVLFRWSNRNADNCSYVSTTDWEILTAKNNGVYATFEGNAVLADNETIYAYYSKGGDFRTQYGVMFRRDIPDIQTGAIEDLKDNLLFYSYIHRNKIKFNKEEEVVTSIEFDAAMSPAVGIVKMTVPAELNLTQIDVESNSIIAGRIYLQPQKTWGTYGDGNSFFHRPPAGDEIPQSKTITIKRNGDIISGDIYIVVAPNAFDTVANNYCCSTEMLKFTFTDSEANTCSHEASLNGKIYVGSCKDLGSLPTNIMTPKVDAGTLSLLNTTALTVAVNDYNSDCTYYYEVGTSPENCKTPTVQSATFDPATGFTPTVSSDFERYFIKVLAHYNGTEYRDVILRASLRNWKFNQDTETASILKQVNDSTLLVEKATGVYTEDGLYVYRTKFAVNNNTDKLPLASISYEANANRIGFTSSNVSLYVTSEYSSNVWLHFNVDKSTAIKNGSTCSYNLYVNKATGRTNSYTDNTGVSHVTLNNEYKSDGTSKKVSVCWNLGNNDEGDMFAFAGDRKHILYSMSYLEVL